MTDLANIITYDEIAGFFSISIVSMENDGKSQYSQGIFQFLDFSLIVIEFFLGAVFFIHCKSLGESVTNFSHGFFYFKFSCYLVRLPGWRSGEEDE